MTMTVLGSILSLIGILFVYWLSIESKEKRDYKKYLREHYTKMYQSGDIYKDKRVLRKSLFYLEYNLLDDMAKKIWKDAPIGLKIEIEFDKNQEKIQAIKRNRQKDKEENLYQNSSGYPANKDWWSSD